MNWWYTPQEEAAIERACQGAAEKMSKYGSSTHEAVMIDKSKYCAAPPHISNFGKPSEYARREWEQWQIDTLCKYYATAKITAIAYCIGRDKDDVNKKAKQLNLKRNRQ